jgi:hypothetical protein
MEQSRQICSNEQTVRLVKHVVYSHCKTIVICSVGLVEARVVGARAAQGDVIVVLDAHCECVSD